MNEYYTRRRPRLEDSREREKEASKNRGGFFLTGFQTVVCIICIIAAIAIKQFGGGFYTTAKGYARDAIKKNMTSADVSQAFNQISGNLFPDASEAFNSGVIKSSSSSGSKENTESSTSSTAASSRASSGTNSSSVPSKKASSKALSKSSSNVTSKATSQVPTKRTTLPTSKSLKAAATGIIVKTSVISKNKLKISNVTAKDSQLAPRYASFSPYKLSEKPVIPVKGQTTSVFGYRINPVTKKRSFHSGIDIAAAGGTPIAAAYAGKVKKVGKSVYYGNYVTLDNGGNITTFYGHCQTVTVKEGETVKAGETIAKVGSTGVSTGSHLHFEIHIGNVCVNPQWVI